MWHQVTSKIWHWQKMPLLVCNAPNRWTPMRRRRRPMRQWWATWSSLDCLLDLLESLQESWSRWAFPPIKSEKGHRQSYKWKWLPWLPSDLSSLPELPCLPVSGPTWVTSPLKAGLLLPQMTLSSSLWSWRRPICNLWPRWIIKKYNFRINWYYLHSK